jgi:Tol biopolymer transport system component
MPELTERFRAADTLPARDLWPDIATREPGPPPPSLAGRRVVAAIVALVVMLIGIAIAVRAFHGSHPVVPAGTAANGEILLGSRPISVMDPDGSHLRALSGLPDHADLPAWSPNGQEIAVAVTSPSRQEIWISRADGSDAHRIFLCTDHFSAAQCGDRFGGLTWSPDGRRIGFVFDGLYAMNADGTGARRLYSLPGTVQSPPAWSPDGRWIAVSIDRPGPPTQHLGGSVDIFLAAVDGSGLRNLTHCGPSAYGKCLPLWPSWSPGGRRIVFADLAMRSIDTIDVDGSSLRTILSAPPNLRRARYLTPLWSPDGHLIAYVLDGPAGAPLVYEMRSDGSDPTSLHVGGELLYSWQRLPKG